MLLVAKPASPWELLGCVEWDSLQGSLFQKQG